MSFRKSKSIAKKLRSAIKRKSKKFICLRQGRSSFESSGIDHRRRKRHRPGGGAANGWERNDRRRSGLRARRGRASARRDRRSRRYGRRPFARRDDGARSQGGGGRGGA